MENDSIQVDAQTQKTRKALVICIVFAILLAIPVAGWLLGIVGAVAIAVRIFIKAKGKRIVVDLGILIGCVWAYSIGQAMGISLWQSNGPFVGIGTMITVSFVALWVMYKRVSPYA